APRRRPAGAAPGPERLPGRSPRPLPSRPLGGRADRQQRPRGHPVRRAGAVRSVVPGPGARGRRPDPVRHLDPRPVSHRHRWQGPDVAFGLPSSLGLTGRRAVVVGGGEVGEQKARALLDAGAAVTVIAERFVPGLKELARRGEVTLAHKPYTPGDLEGAFLAV